MPLIELPALEQALDDTVCAVMMEPVQGEGGIHPARPDVIVENVGSMGNLALSAHSLIVTLQAD